MRSETVTREGESPVVTTRRAFVARTLVGLGGFALLAACGGAEQNDPAGATAGAGTASGSGAGGAGGGATASASSGGGATASGTGGGGSGPGVCTLYPQETQGPFYLNLDLLRSDITEGKPGAKLTLEVQVIRASDCAPIAGAAVDVWHCDAGGIYSGYPNQLGGLDTTGQTFLRGTQVTDAEGRVTFVTIYPGWYPGRTTHIHFKVHPTETTEATSQLYFPEDVTSAVYATSPYDAHGQKDTTNAADATAQTGGFPPLLAISETADGRIATLTVTVAG